jgi:branched-chain amino acid transport system ATP-binding protein
MTQQVLSQGIDLRTADERRAEALEILEDHLPDQVRRGAVLEARDVSKAFGGLQALTEVSLEVGAAQTTGLIGPNGAGKSTMFDVLNGFTIPDTGTVTAFGEDITRWSPWQRAKLGMCRTFQANRIAMNLSVEDNLLIGAHLCLSGGLFQTALRTPKAWASERNAKEAARAVAHLLDLEPLMTVRAGVLDFGSQRRIEIGRSLLGGARLVLLDEATAGLDAVEAHGLLSLVKRLQIDLGLAVLIIEHHVRSVMNMCDMIYVLDQGRLICSGPPSVVRVDPQVQSAYLGEERSL